MGLLHDEIGTDENVFIPLKEMLKADLPTDMVNKCKDMRKILVTLERQGLIMIGNYQFLLDRFDLINYKKEEVINRVKQFQERIQALRGTSKTPTGASIAGLE